MRFNRRKGGSAWKRRYDAQGLTSFRSDKLSRLSKCDGYLLFELKSKSYIYYYTLN